MNKEEVDKFSEDLKNIHAQTTRCGNCHLGYENDANNLCPICRNKSRNSLYICVVETDRDAYTIEKSRAFNGVYHVLGKKVSLVGDSLSPAILGVLEERLKKLGSAEVVLAMNATPEGQATALWLERALRPVSKKITRLGRGLSSGTEIEYADQDTLVDAFQNRK